MKKESLLSSFQTLALGRLFTPDSLALRGRLCARPLVLSRAFPKLPKALGKQSAILVVLVISLNIL